ncbi:MAG: DUF2339 domain-containing protein [Cypionkella sp.]
MGWLPLLLLAVAVAVLWRRVSALERRVREFKVGRAAHFAVPAQPLREPLPATPAAPAPAPADDAVQAEDAARADEAAQAADTAADDGADDVAPRAREWLPTVARVDFEDLFGRRLPIWAGGVALAAAGFFLVRWSIDQGLLTPAVRVALAGLFGLALLGGAEAAYRWRARVADPRVAQALAGAGLATLYAAFYLAGTGYGLIGSTLAFLGLAGVTAAAIALSYRFGVPSAVLGLVGGFAAPALVGAEAPNPALLSIYLALVTAGLAHTGERQQRPWLAMAALAAGLGWGAVLLLAAPGTPDGWALGAYLVLLGAVIPALAGERAAVPPPVRAAVAGLAALQLAALVRLGGFGALEWGLYLLLGGALAWSGWRAPALRAANAVAAAVGVALLALWPDPSPAAFAAVAAAFLAIFALVPLLHLGRRDGLPLDAAQAGGAALGVGAVAVAHFGAVLPAAPHPLLAAALLALALVPSAAVLLGERVRPAPDGAEWLVAQVAAALLAIGAAAQLLPPDALAWTAAGATILAAWRAPRLGGAVGTFALLAALWALGPLGRWLEASGFALVGDALQVGDLPAPRDVPLYLLPAVAAGAGWALLAPPSRHRGALVAVTGGLAVVAAHVLFRHGFAALVGDDFVATGIMQRALWEVLLLAAAWAAWSRGWGRGARILAAAALAHFAWFALILHNPLWSAQAVGPLPVVNALLPAYGAGLAALWLLRRWLPAEPAILRWAIDAALMASLVLLALSLLRHAFAGSLLAAVPIGQGEDLLRSLLGIALAVGFLLWGARSGERSWRIGSLALMLGAVLKVFLVDAAGLAGLARIASFMALGFSLIGIGWFYTRQLRVPGRAAAT